MIMDRTKNSIYSFCAHTHIRARSEKQREQSKKTKLLRIGADAENKLIFAFEMKAYGWNSKMKNIVYTCLTVCVFRIWTQCSSHYNNGARKRRSEYMWKKKPSSCACTHTLLYVLCTHWRSHCAKHRRTEIIVK